MDQQTIDWLKKGPKLKGNILEVGSFNVNGSARYAIPITIGIDMRPGPDVDLVLDAIHLVSHFGPESFDHVISCDMLEHCELWREAVNQMWQVLKPNGWLFITACRPPKGRHNYPNDYWRFTTESFAKIFEGLSPSISNLPTTVAAKVQKTGPLVDLSAIEVIAID